MDGWMDIVPTGRLAAAAYLKWPESEYVTLEQSCWDDQANGETCYAMRDKHTTTGDQKD
jgi:hypothetical protein